MVGKEGSRGGPPELGLLGDVAGRTTVAPAAKITSTPACDGAAAQLVDRDLGDQLPVGDHPDPVAELLHLPEQVAVACRALAIAISSLITISSLSDPG